MSDDLADKLAYWRANGAPGMVRAAPRERVHVDERTGEKTRHRAVLNEHTGERAGRHIDHGDGHTDATVERPQVVVNHDLIAKRKEAG